MMSADNTHNQRVVYAALRRMTTDRNVIQSAYQHWLSTMGNKAFEVPEAVEEIRKFLGLDTGERKTLMVSMHAAAGKLLEELDEVPGYMQGGSLASSGATPQEEGETNQVVKLGSPHAQATKMFCMNFVKHVARANAEDYREFTEACSAIDYSSNKKVQAAMLAFAQSSFASLELPSDITESECADVAAALHLLASEFVGPMTADQLQTKTISGLTTMDFATQFDPRKLT